ncbi:MAG: TIGR01212 family radical SAM protein [Desulfamplus sp.]|nr:TIGR01212 family radical SAM protein [Desulfamplus sp.]
MGYKRKYLDYNSYLKSLYGERIQKIVVDAGLNCPNRDGSIAKGGCIYCNSSGSGSGLWAKGLSITEQIELGRKAMSRRYNAKKFLVYFQSYTNTYTTCESMRAMYDEALGVDGVVGMAIGTRPDCIDQEKIELIASYTDKYLVWLEYGLQSSHNSTLKLINRGHNFKCFVDAVNLVNERNLKLGSKINICAHVILGLPKETKEMMLETAHRIGELGINGVKIHLLYVIKGTFLEAMWKRCDYCCMTQNEYVDAVCDFIAHLPKNMVIQRITGDPHPKELVAPEWALDKQTTFNMIQQTFEKRGSWQGKFF